MIKAYISEMVRWECSSEVNLRYDAAEWTLDSLVS